MKKLMKCCVGIIAPDGRMIPFCAYNNVGYREDVKQELLMARARARLQKRATVGARQTAPGASGSAEGST